MTDPLPPSGARPVSAVAQLPAFIGLGLALAGLVILKHLAVANAISALVIMMALYSAPNLLAEYLRQPKAPLLRLHYRSEGTIARLATKFAALAATAAVIAIAYASLPVYQGDLLGPLFGVLNRIALPALVLLPAYVYVTDARMADPHDGCYMVGLIATGRWQQADLGMAWQYALGWIVKGFFLPLMISFASGDMNWFLKLDLAQAFAGSYGWYEFCYRFFFFVDVFVACSGYLLTLKFFDSHIRSTEPTLAGWAAALICYPPFWNMVESNYLHYEDKFYWGQWLEAYPALKFIWALAILFLVLVYVWATLSFGIRFSNLTHRGILTNGPYGYVRHPAYLCKNLSWWLVSVPFVVTSSLGETLTHCAMLATVNLIYYARAKTEERHLMRDPAYQAYIAWLDENGLAARLRRFVRQAGMIPAR